MAVVIAVGCGSRKSREVQEIKSVVKEIDRSCPISVGLMGDLTGVSFEDDGDVIVYHFVLSENTASLTDFTNQDKIIDRMKFAFLGADAKEFIGKIADAGVSVRFRIDDRSGKTLVDITLTDNDLHALSDEGISDAEKADALVIMLYEDTKAMCPSEIEPGMTLVDVLLDDNGITCVYDIDGDMYDLDLLSADAGNNIKESMKYIVRDPSVKPYAKSLAMKNMGYTYCYREAGGENSFSVTLSAEDINNVLL